MSGRLEQRIAVVTGGASGIGAGVAREFARAGAQVAVWDIQADSAARVAGEIGGVAVTVDVSRLDQVERAMEETVSSLGTVDILHNSAGIMATGVVDGDPVSDTVLDLPDAMLRRVLDVNLFGTIYCCKVALSSMVARKRGVIITTASGAAHVGFAGIAAYTACRCNSRSVVRECPPTSRIWRSTSPQTRRPTSRGRCSRSTAATWPRSSRLRQWPVGHCHQPFALDAITVVDVVAEPRRGVEDEAGEGVDG
jgi:NADP-dependent 3-hydroxy acid dehydrogenase YdfG